MAGLDWLTARPVAHRGLHGGDLVENTLGAARAAVAGKYGIEVDLQLSTDGEVVVFHDATLDRLTHATGPVAARSAAELKSVALRETSERIPTLTELLATVAGQVPLVLELKSEWNGDSRLAKRVAQSLLPYAGPVAAMSFDPDMVDALREAASGLPRGIVAERRYSHAEWDDIGAAQRFMLANLLHFNRTKPHFVAYRCEDLPSVAPLIARYGLGMRLLSWTVRSPREHRRVGKWVDQVIFEGFRP